MKFYSPGKHQGAAQIGAYFVLLKANTKGQRKSVHILYC